MKKTIVIVILIFAVIILSVCLLAVISDRDNERGSRVTKIPSEPISSPKPEYSRIEGTEEIIIDVPRICQYPALPTGCEATATAMVMQFYGSDTTPEYFARNWLECNNSFWYEDGVLHGPNPNEVFAGDPFTSSSYGCFAVPITNAVNKSGFCTAKTIIGESLETLCENYISAEKPLLIWATMGMKESYAGNSWMLRDGTRFVWTAGEHCMVLVGYNENFYYFNDPQSGNTVAYQKHIAEQRYKELGSQAVYITPKA